MSATTNMLITKGEKLMKENPGMTWEEAMEKITGLKQLEEDD